MVDVAVAAAMDANVDAGSAASVTGGAGWRGGMPNANGAPLPEPGSPLIVSATRQDRRPERRSGGG